MLLYQRRPVAAAHEKKTCLGFPSSNVLLLESAPFHRYIHFEKDTKSFTPACCRSVLKHVRHKKCVRPLLHSILPTAMFEQMRVEEVWISTSVHLLCADVSGTKLQVTEIDLNLQLGTRNWFVSQTFTCSYRDTAVQIITTWAFPPALALAR